MKLSDVSEKDRAQWNKKWLKFKRKWKKQNPGEVLHIKPLLEQFFKSNGLEVE